MQDVFALIDNPDGSQDLYVYYDRALATEFALDFLYDKRDPAKAAGFLRAVDRQFAVGDIRKIKILLGGVVIASMPYAAITAMAAPRTGRTALGYLFSGSPAQQLGYVERTGGVINTLSPSWFDLNPDGSLKQNPIDPGLVEYARQNNLEVTPFLSNHWQREPGVAAVENYQSLAVEIADAVAANRLDGVQVDLENLTPDQRDGQTALVARLRQLLPAQKQVSVAVAANPNGYTTGWQGSYDYAGLAQNADYLMLMAYDEHWQGSPPGPVAGLPFVRRSIEQLLRYAPPEKIVLGMPLFGRLWSSDGRFNGQAVTQRRAQQLVELFNAQPQFDAASQSPYAVFSITQPTDQTVGGVALQPGDYTLWYEDARSLQQKAALIDRYGLKGGGFWALGQEDPAIWPQIAPWLQGGSGQYGVVTASRLNLREAPNTQSAIITVLPRDQRVELLSLEKDWYYVRTAEGRTGYVSADYIRPLDTPDGQAVSTFATPPQADAFPDPPDGELEIAPQEARAAEADVDMDMNMDMDMDIDVVAHADAAVDAALDAQMAAEPQAEAAAQADAPAYTAAAAYPPDPLAGLDVVTDAQADWQRAQEEQAAAALLDEAPAAFPEEEMPPDIPTQAPGDPEFRPPRPNPGPPAPQPPRPEPEPPSRPPRPNPGPPPSQPPRPAPEPPPPQPLLQTGVVTAAMLRVRARPSLQAPVIGMLQRGSRVFIRQSQNGWLMVAYRGRWGYVASAFVRRQPG